MPPDSRELESEMGENPTGSNWPSRDRVLGLVLLAITALAFYLCYLLAIPFLPSLAWAIAFAVIVHPVHAWLERKLKRPAIAAGVAVFLVVVLIVGPTAFVARQITREVASNAEILPERIAALTQQFPALAPVFESLENGEIPTEIKDTVKNVATSLPGYVSGSLWVGAQLLFTMFFLFYFFRDRKTWMSSLRSLLPLSPTEVEFAFDRIENTIFATVYGSVSVAFVQGALGGFMFWMLGLSSPVLWGLVMGILAVVPVLGTFVIWTPTAILLAAEGQWIKAAILVTWGATAIGLIDNVLYPVLVGKRLHLHPILVFVSIVGGLAMFGVAGVVLGPVTLSVTEAMIQVWRKRFSEEQEATQVLV